MSAVLLDNLSIGNVVDRMNSRKFPFDSYIKNYLYAFILWDDIYALNARYSIRIGENPDKVMYDDNLGIKRLSFSYYDMEMLAEELDYEYWGRGENGEISPRSVRRDSIFYLLLSYNLGMNVLLSDERTTFIEKSGLAENIFSRADILSRLDKEIVEYYQEVNASIGKKIFKMKMPVLVDYIASNANNFEEAKEIALRIKYDPDVIKFREAMDSMDRALNEGKIVEFNDYMKVIPEIVNAITYKEFDTKTFDIGISLSPSIAFPLNMGKLRLRRKKINMNFLLNLTKYGIRNEQIEFWP